MRFTDQVAVITGGAAGIGYGYARAFAAEGAAVAIADRDHDAAERSAAEIVANGGRAIAVGVDVSRSEEVEAMAASVVAQLGGIDILCNNAGLHLGRTAESSTLPAQEWLRIFDVNVVGALRCAQACVSSMAERGGGVIVNQSSTASYVAGGGAYGASKLALNHLTMSLATDYADRGVRVVGIAPGMIATDAVRAGIAPEHEHLVLRTQLIKRFGVVDDCVATVLFLCSGDASFITGQTFTVDGGFGLRP